MTPEFLSAEPLADHIIAVTTQGAVDLDDVNVNLNGKVGDFAHVEVSNSKANYIARPSL